MNDDKTVFKPTLSGNAVVDEDRTVIFKPDALNVSLVGSQGEIIAAYSFSDRFTAGRSLDNSIVIKNDVVSRHHLEVKWENGGWWIANLQSANGLYINGRLIQQKEKLNLPCSVALGLSGIQLKIQLAKHAENDDQTQVKVLLAEPLPVDKSHAARNLSQEHIKSRLLAEEAADDMGDYTLMVRKLIHEDRVVRKKGYKKIIWALGSLFLLSLGLAAYQQIALNNARKLAIDMFYDIKMLEVGLSQADIKLEESAETLDKTMRAISTEKLRIEQEQLKLEQEKIAAERKRMLQDRERLANMKAKYRQYVEEANSLRLRFPTKAQYEEELIAKVARELGESELELPEDFVVEVRKYIQYWQGSSRIQRAIETLEKNSLLPIVIDTLKKHGMPLYFIYLPLQESNYDTQAIGPETKYGVAKGAWQLLASTAQQYGVEPGPLANVPEYDELDGRFDFNQATQAGIKYLRHIYSTEAQASGLLVMASYNYGDNRVKGMINKMPDNPRDKNFWKFLQQYELPKETKDYVFYIFSAAVIGEDPQHFGFKFNPPLFNASQ
ncbi:FHA domain-containing protein [Methylicorpusculum sp.]|uniref:FHA domain-containing protein n=1 Tax=Methylicorpusculum sp. TaxID=2713644 RepID=UPI002728E24B|nr:FHA domain-containing protein [Methylicorpusculum sp.]MDO8844651.1 FHA domain-containing protein [Methylicorpusculum sp.]